MSNHKSLLKRLSNLSQCNNELAMDVKKIILEPFQVNTSTIGASRPSSSAFTDMAVRLGPVASNIVNQNIHTMGELTKISVSDINYTVVLNCLIDSSFYALTALRHMNGIFKLKSLDIEKTTSNIISSMVDLGEYDRSLEEMIKFRSLVASAAKVSLDLKLSTLQDNDTSLSPRNILNNRNRNIDISSPRLNSIIPDSLITNQWENTMLKKYQELFYFPFQPAVNNRAVILLILNYQISTMKCWLGLNEGRLLKFIPYLINKIGSLAEWCQHLLKYDSSAANKQIDVIHQLLNKSADKLSLIGKYPYKQYMTLSIVIDPFIPDNMSMHCYELRMLSLSILNISTSQNRNSLLTFLIRHSITLERSADTGKYTSYLYTFFVLIQYSGPL
ncbi:hypothetical protein BDB01DRAFT_719148 [Pilobolus umbonatus]|nr:hypothetical protein BDB01DRAFT_719148 [Pilobolus umbonatus]